MARHLYVYYPVPAAGLPAVLPAVRALQSQLTAAWPGLQTGLLRRPEWRDGTATLMETYTGLPVADAARLADTLACAAIDAGLPQPRHTEWFDDLEAP